MGADIPNLPTGRPAADAAELGRSGHRLPLSFLVLTEMQSSRLQKLLGRRVQWGPSGGNTPTITLATEALPTSNSDSNVTKSPALVLPATHGVRLGRVNKTGLESWRTKHSRQGAGSERQEEEVVGGQTSWLPSCSPGGPIPAPRAAPILASTTEKSHSGENQPQIWTPQTEP